MHDLTFIFTEWLLHYGAPILFVMLFLGIVGLPIPDETLFVVSGWLIAKGKVDPVTIIIAAIFGSICGITFSYWLGRNTGSWLIKKFGPKIRLSESRVQKVTNWYLRFGKWTLLVGYFIPGVRHLTGYIAGGSQLKFKEFMLFAFTGAILWAVTFLSLGYFFLIQVFPFKP